MKSKTIILSSPNEKTAGRGILTIFEEDGLLQCRLRLYNITKLSKYCKIGVYHNNEVSSANLLEKSGVYTSSLVGSFDIDKDFYTAIIDTENNNDVIISGGTYAGFFANDDSVFEKKFSRIHKDNQDTDLLSSVDDKIDTLDSENTQCHSDRALASGANPMNEAQNKCDDCDKCLNCKYKEYFYSHAEQEIEDEGDTLDSAYAPLGMTQCHSECSEAEAKNPTNEENAIDLRDPSTPSGERDEAFTHHPTSLRMTEALIPQFQYVFENYQADETLNKLIPNSKFVKINEQLEQYSIGAIYDNDEMKYICYAVLCNYNEPAPQELGEHYQWLPLDKEDPLSEGYYIVFQDATDLKIVDL